MTVNEALPPALTGATRMPGAGQVRQVRELLSELGPAQARPRSTVFPTGFDPLDTILEGGIRTGDLVLVGGAPGVGKTIAALQWARHLAASGRSAIYACFEHDEVTLLARLLSMEVGELVHEGAHASQGLRQSIVDVASGARGLHDALSTEPTLRGAHDRLESYADRLWLIKASGSRTTVDQLAVLALEHAKTDTALFVDYLQKVPVRPDPVNEAEKVLRTVESLKDLALSLHIPVVCVAAAEQAGPDHRRLRLEHLRGSSALAYESDIVVMLNDKVDAVSKVHLAYDSVKAATFKHQVVFSLEKYRSGQAQLNVEFTKDFSHYRFDPLGGFVAERLSDDRLQLE